jgi:hypothetical protein
MGGGKAMMDYSQTTEGRIMHHMHNGRGIDTPYGSSMDAEELRRLLGEPSDFGDVLSDLERHGRIGLRRNADGSIVALAMRW